MVARSRYTERELAVMAVDWAVVEPAASRMIEMPKFRIRAEIFEERRKAAKLKVESVIRRADCSRGTWDRLFDPKKEEMNLKVLGNIAAVLGIDPHEVLEWKPDGDPDPTPPSTQMP